MRRFDGFEVQISRFECQILECFKKGKGNRGQGLKLEKHFKHMLSVHRKVRKLRKKT